MGDFKNKLIRFMYGRYGTDQLYIALVIASFVLMLINSFIHSNILSIFIWVVLIFTFYRSFSKNIFKRRRENQMFLKIWSPIKAKSSLTIRRLKEFKTHRYRKCPHCKKVLRLPRKTGNHTVNCPVCHKDFKVRILF
ncbi:hypothetical protein [Clostridium sp. 'White wine YQ']|uniref:hypothetical protein n=1 Tax=Clostridium sp. 'White wine YQ' TaxID=3027474 RepID=UPI0023669548|nr:hypothetical protein [Clostridium sp. 'White wine YQ']MDD7794363.1 hypothetical protein [Clostridium sp. 'White wine YQ']